MANRGTTRRGLLAAAPAAGLLWGCRNVFGAGAPSEKLNVAVIGFGQRGHHVLRGFWLRARERGEVNLVAIADPNRKSGHDWVGKGDESWHDPSIELVDRQVASVPRFQDYRVMFDRMGKDFDAVAIFAMCSNHFPAAMYAMQRGKHVFVEKPMCMTVEEARRMRLEAEKQKVVTQMGIQGHGDGGPRMLREWVQKGLLGEVREVHCTGAGNPYRNRPTTGDPIPDHFVYDTWLGPAPMAPFATDYITRRGWCTYKDFTIGGWGETYIHSFEGAFYGLHVDAPQTVSVVDREGGEAIELAYPARGALPPVTFVIHRNRERQVDMADCLPFPKEMDAESRKELLSHHSFAHVVIPGSKYTAYIRGYADVRIVPHATLREFVKLHGKLGQHRYPKGHYGSFVDACKVGRPADSSANFGYAGPLMETICLLNVATRVAKKGKALEWDAEKLRITNDEDADRLLRRPYRKGWEVPDTPSEG